MRSQFFASAFLATTCENTFCFSLSLALPDRADYDIAHTCGRGRYRAVVCFFERLMGWTYHELKKRLFGTRINIGSSHYMKQESRYVSFGKLYIFLRNLKCDLILLKVLYYAKQNTW